MAKSHNEYVNEVMCNLTEVRCGAPDCGVSLPIDVANHVDLRQVLNLKSWDTLTLADMEAAQAFFCEQHQRLLVQAQPGIRFMPLERTIQSLAQHRHTMAVRAEEAMAAKERRQKQIEAAAAKVQAMQAFAVGRFNPEAGPKIEPVPLRRNGRLHVVRGDLAQARA